MERLTKRTETGVAYLADPVTLQSSLEDRGKVARMVDRLAAYEDTGLMPDEINELPTAWMEQVRKLLQYSPCDLCKYNPPSSGDGKPCSMCPAVAKRKDGD